MGKTLHQAQSHGILRSWQCQRTDINHHKDFVLPIFVGNNDDSVEPIESMPNVFRYGGNKAIEYLKPLVYSFGLRAVLLFPVMTKSDRIQFTVAKGLDPDMEDDEDDGSDRDILSSNSSDSRYSPPSTTSSDDERALPERITTEVTANSQNPFENFLDQDEEEQDHLLAGEQTSGAQDVRPIPRAVADSQRRIENLVVLPETSHSHDVRLIKGMALKDKHNPVLRLIPRLRETFPNLLIVCDVCLCAFTSTGHCCLFDDHSLGNHENSDYLEHLPRSAKTGTFLNHFPISNKITCQYLAMLSVEYALRGCNVVAPSDMMDGRIQIIRQKLDEKRLSHVSIMSYSAKFASAFYGPFRHATGNAPEFSDRKAYQLPPGSRGLALKAVERDIKQGADFVMVKPAGPYLDIVRDIKERYPEVPIAVYQVSGEYSMMKVAADAGVLDLKRAINEMLAAYRRSGATIIISYFTPEILMGELSIAED